MVCIFCDKPVKQPVDITPRRFKCVDDLLGRLERGVITVVKPTHCTEARLSHTRIK